MGFSFNLSGLDSPEAMAAQEKARKDLQTWFKFTPEQNAAFEADPSSNPYPGLTVWSGGNLGLPPGSGYYASPYSDFKSAPGEDNGNGILGQTMHGIQTMLPGLSIMALPLFAGAGAAGAGAETGTYGLGEAYGGLAAPEAGGGAAAATAGGAQSGNMLVADAAGTPGTTMTDVSPGLNSGGGSSMGEDGLDLTRLEDPSYWNPEGGTTGLSDPGASGIEGSSTTYGSTDYMQAAQDMAKQLGITPASALKLLLAGGGALLGGAKGGAKPAGTTTTTQDLPDWLKPYAQGNVAQGQQILQGINPNNPLLPASQNEAMKTIRGDYLDPNSNPYFASSVNDALGLAKSQFAGMYGGGPGNNLNNSGFQEGLARTLGQQATNAYAQNYNTERGRQATAAFGAPQLVSQGNAAAFSGNQAFAGLFPNVSSTTVPYFSNPIGNMFSGALGGYALGGGMGK